MTTPAARPDAWSAEDAARCRAVARGGSAIESATRDALAKAEQDAHRDALLASFADALHAVGRPVELGGLYTEAAGWSARNRRRAAQQMGARQQQAGG
jgi:hypothetical protein